MLKIIKHVIRRIILVSIISDVVLLLNFIFRLDLGAIFQIVLSVLTAVCFFSLTNNKVSANKSIDFFGEELSFKFIVLHH